MLERVALILPTRGRPKKVEESIDGWRGYSTMTDLWVFLDDDDPEVEAYERHPDVNYVVWPRRRMCPTVNHAAVMLATQYRYLGFMGDDHVPRTPDWDAKLAEACGEWGIAYGDDKLQGENLATHCVQTSNIVSTVGYMALPGTVHLYMDNFWMVLGSECGFLHYLPDVVVEHMHFVNGKSEQDDRYAEVNASSVYSHDGAVFNRWLTNGTAADDIAKIKAAMS